MTHTTSPLDLAIAAHRENPTEQTRQRLFALQQAQHGRFVAEQTADYQRRTHS